MNTYDIAVIGAGPAGCMAAIQAARSGKSVVLLERNSSLGRKILLSGGGRCNITNAADIEIFLEAFGKHGTFFRQAFLAFSNQDLIDFFNACGLSMKTEDSGRVFPGTGQAASVVSVLKDALAKHQVTILYNTRLITIQKQEDLFKLITENKNELYAINVVLAPGGASYKATGSTGDGYRIAQELGHSLTALEPGLVPLKTKEGWVKDLQGLSLPNISINFNSRKTRKVSRSGEIIFTHFGISGPLALDLSIELVPRLSESKEIPVFLDLVPELEPPVLESKFLAQLAVHKNLRLKNALSNFVPRRLAAIVLKLAGVSPDAPVNQLTSQKRRAILKILKSLPLTLTGSLALDEAMVTRGGIPLEEIDPRTMESKLVPGLFFAGEIIEGCGLSGGYNLQRAFSTGFLAGIAAFEGKKVK